MLPFMGVCGGEPLLPLVVGGGGPLSLLVGAGSGLLSLLVGWCWAVFAIHGVVLGHCCLWGGVWLLSLFVGTVLWVVVLGHVCCSWGGAGLLLSFVGWC